MKKAMRQLLALIMVGLMAVSAGAVAEDIVTPPMGVQKGTELVVGAPTPMSGHFGTELWGNNTADVDARLLLHGYALIEKDKTPGTKPHGVAVAGMEARDEADGSRVYTVTLADGLTYNNGAPIGAADYVLALLLAASPAICEIGGTAQPMDHIRGYEAYQRGETDTFAGVRLLSRLQFSVQVEALYSPYFYELTLLAITPLPISEIAPGGEVVDDGAGAYVKGDFSAQLLVNTLLDPQTGYEFFPKVTSGPYQLDAYDAATHTATFSVNPNFKGNHEGQTPHIEKLTFTHVENETMFDQLEAGQVQLLNKVANAKAIVRSQEVITNNAAITGSPYLRSGLTFLSFACEEGLASSLAVRQAVAMSIDKDALTVDMMSGMAMRAYGYYGLGQWMTVYADYEDAGLSATVLETLQGLDIPQDAQGAAKLLADEGWNLDADGNPYDGSGIRYRQGDGGLEPLVIKWAKPVENSAADVLEAALTDGLTAIGMGLEVTELPFETLLRHYYRQEPRTYDMFFLATNFGYVFDPYYDFHTEDIYQGSTNRTGMKDDELMQLGLKMRTTAPNDLGGYMKHWMAFQERFVKVLPMVPLFSGVYMDVYSIELQGYDILGYSSWALAIPYAWME